MRILWENNEIFTILFRNPAGSPGAAPPALDDDEVFTGRIDNSNKNLSKNKFLRKFFSKISSRF